MRPAREWVVTTIDELSRLQRSHRRLAGLLGNSKICYEYFVSVFCEVWGLTVEDGLSCCSRLDSSMAYLI
ncbi:hypothetical protein EVAR_21709_1 [Eumeta japonica]|uniref:Uncharacterized protein n=1 Tax=Eumeta variegata TaxID=151549 RepID=A0A4C1W6A9_EUMVA|nr:hypothetical protein EVAR_21709_1 [Eumeta japonica]